jgi:hypothetical protein
MQHAKLDQAFDELNGGIAVAVEPAMVRGRRKCSTNRTESASSSKLRTVRA